MMKIQKKRIRRRQRRRRFITATNSSSDTDNNHNHNNDDDDAAYDDVNRIEIARYHGRIPLIDMMLALDNNNDDEIEIVDGAGTTHKFRCWLDPRTIKSLSLSSISVASLAYNWKRLLYIRSKDVYDNSLLKHAELIVTEETIARNDRWKKVVVTPPQIPGNDDNWRESNNDNTAKEKNSDNLIVSSFSTGMSPSCRNILMYASSNYAAVDHTATTNASATTNSKDNLSSSSILFSDLFQSKILRFGLDVAEYKENCRYIQTLLWIESTTAPSSSATVAAMSSLLSSSSGINPTSPPPTSSSSSSLKSLAVAAAAAVVSAVVQPSSSSSSSSRTTTTMSNVATATTRKTAMILRLVKDVWQRASGLLHEVMSILSSRDVGSRSLDTLCEHIEFIITLQRRRRPPSSSLRRHHHHHHTRSIKEGKLVVTKETKSKDSSSVSSSSNNIAYDESISSSSSTINNHRQHQQEEMEQQQQNYHEFQLLDHHQRGDPPPIDLFDNLLNELRTYLM